MIVNFTRVNPWMYSACQSHPGLACGLAILCTTKVRIHSTPPEGVIGYLLDERSKRAISSYLGVAKIIFVCECVGDYGSDQMLWSILTKLSTQVFQRNTSVEFGSGKTHFNRFKMAPTLNILWKICLERLIIF